MDLYKTEPSPLRVGRSKWFALETHLKGFLNHGLRGILYRRSGARNSFWHPSTAHGSWARQALIVAGMISGIVSGGTSCPSSERARCGVGVGGRGDCRAEWICNLAPLNTHFSLKYHETSLAKWPPLTINTKRAGQCWAVSHVWKDTFVRGYYTIIPHQKFTLHTKDKIKLYLFHWRQQFLPLSL